MRERQVMRLGRRWRSMVGQVFLIWIGKLMSARINPVWGKVSLFPNLLRTFVLCVMLICVWDTAVAQENEEDDPREKEALVVPGNVCSISVLKSEENRAQIAYRFDSGQANTTPFWVTGRITQDSQPCIRFHARSMDIARQMVMLLSELDVVGDQDITIFDRNGMWVAQTAFRNGKASGRWQRWYPAGELWAQQEYADGLMYAYMVWEKTGQLSALYHHTSEGQLKQRWNIRGMPTYELREYRENGHILKHIRSWSGDGRLITDRLYRDGILADEK